MNKYANGARARRLKLLEIVEGGAAATQAEIASKLKRAGFRCTQASVSRDISSLGLIKRSGRYAAAEQGEAIPRIEEFAHSIREFLKGAEQVGKNLVVVKALPGTAQSVAEFLDKSGWEGIAGTVAGDNTVFVAVRGPGAARRTARDLDRAMRG